MKILSDRNHLALLINVNVNWYNQQAVRHNQGKLSLTWVKYVAKLNQSQWKALQSGSSALPLHTYHRVLNLIRTMEETVLGRTYQPIKRLIHQEKASMSKAKQNMQNVLANLKHSKPSRYKTHSNPKLNRAKRNLQKVLGSIQQNNSQPKQVITLIKAQKRKNRFNVYVNGRYAFPVGIDELTKYHLRIGMPITKRQSKVISHSANLSKMFSKASTRIIHHLRTEHEIRKWLKQKYDCSADNADRVIKRLKDYHLIDDEHYAREYIRSQIVSGSKGPEAIARHLRSKGINALTIQQAIKQRYPLTKQLTVAEHQAKDKFKIHQNTPFNKRLRKIKLSLVRKGFSFDVSSQAIEECHFQPDHSHQKQLLSKYTQRAFRRYGRQLNANNHYQINMKIKRYLFRKGFGFDAIDQAIDEYKQSHS